MKHQKGLGIICIFALLALTSVSSAPVSSLAVIECIKCLEYSKIFTKNLYSISPDEFSCANSTLDFKTGILVIGQACSFVDCLKIDEKPLRVYNKTELCIHNKIDCTDFCSKNFSPGELVR